MDLNDQTAAHFENSVIEFMEAMGQNLTIDQQAVLVVEEGREFMEALDASEENLSVETLAALLKEMADFFYVLAGLAVVTARNPGSAGTPPSKEVLKAVVAAQAVGEVLKEISDFIPPPILIEAFNRVHASNMSKLGDDGKPIFSPEGKVLKGPNYKPPVLDDLAKAVIGILFMQATLSEAA